MSARCGFFGRGSNGLASLGTHKNQKSCPVNSETAPIKNTRRELWHIQLKKELLWYKNTIRMGDQGHVSSRFTYPNKNIILLWGERKIVLPVSGMIYMQPKLQECLTLNLWQSSFMGFLSSSAIMGGPKGMMCVIVVVDIKKKNKIKTWKVSKQRTENRKVLNNLSLMSRWPILFLLAQGSFSGVSAGALKMF